MTKVENRYPAFYQFRNSARKAFHWRFTVSGIPSHHPQILRLLIERFPNVSLLGITFFFTERVGMHLANRFLSIAVGSQKIGHFNDTCLVFKAC